MTRRVVTPQPTIDFDPYPDFGGCGPFSDGHYGFCDEKGKEYFCPYGKAGDRLWVKESWATGNGLGHWSPSKIESACREAGYTKGPYCDLWYKADGSYRQWGSRKHTCGNKGLWRSSLFMPQWASRITLEIVFIRVERVQDITEEDSEKEGVIKRFECDDFASFMNKTFDPRKSESYKIGYKYVWDSINAKRGFSWDLNPWVWVIEFKELSY